MNRRNLLKASALIPFISLPDLAKASANNPNHLPVVQFEPIRGKLLFQSQSQPIVQAYKILGRPDDLVCRPTVADFRENKCFEDKDFFCIYRTPREALCWVEPGQHVVIIEQKNGNPYLPYLVHGEVIMKQGAYRSLRDIHDGISPYLQMTDNTIATQIPWK